MYRTSDLIIDLFAGGGGASEGIRLALGRDPDIAVNHDPVAVAMHEANHPGTVHYREDVWKVPPLVATQGRPVRLLWGSPDCKHFSRAKGGPPTRDKEIRSLAWVIVKWAQMVRPRVIILENVEEFTTWGPLDSDGKIIAAQKGVTFRTFLWQLRRLGYAVEHKCLRACDYGAPTIRKRLFLIARSDGLPIVWPEPTHGPGHPLPWRTAAECIDWTIPCPSIFERKKPLAEATQRRIAEGIRRYVLEAAEPFIVTYYGPKRAFEFRGCGPRDPLGTQTTANRHALVTAFLAKHFGGVVGQAVNLPASTITSIDHHSLLTAHMTKYYGTSIGSDADAPLHTVTAGSRNGDGRKMGLVTSHLVKLRGTCRDGQNSFHPMPTVTAGGLHVGEVRAFLIKYFGTAVGQSLADPAHTLTSKDRMGLVMVNIKGEPYVIADIGMRMLSPRELFRAQGFSDDYRIDIEVDGRRISKADQVRMCGNSVCPPIAAALVMANVRASVRESTRICL